MKRSLVVTACFLGMALSRFAFAADYTAADALFDLRNADDRSSVTKAVAAYEAVLKGTTGADRIYGLARVAQLQVFEAGYTKGLSDDQRKDIFDKCYEDSERLNPSNFSGLKVPHYYTFRTLCLGQWGRLETNPVKKLARIPVLKSMVNQSLAQTDAQQLFYGYGVLRVVAAIKINPAADIAGLYDKVEGLRMLSDTGDGMFTQANLDKNYEDDALLVRDYVENYRYRAEALVANGLKDQAKALLDAKIAEITQAAADGLLPAGREPETLGELDLMKSYRATLN